VFWCEERPDMIGTSSFTQSGFIGEQWSVSDRDTPYHPTVYCHSIAEFIKFVKPSYSLKYHPSEAAMSNGERMTLNEYRSYLRLTTKRYRKANKLQGGVCWTR
jgi:hypothetical protein